MWITIWIKFSLPPSDLPQKPASPMKLLLLSVLAFGAVLASPDGKGARDGGQSSQLDCSSLVNETAPYTCTYDPQTLSLSFGRVTTGESLVAIIASLFTVTQQHYWKHLEVQCVSSTEPQITAQLFTGAIKFESITLVGNCTKESFFYRAQDEEVLRMSISQNELTFSDYGGYMAPVKLGRLAELTLKKIAFYKNALDRYFSLACAGTVFPSPSLSS